MACLKVGSKSDLFQCRGQTWFCAAGLPSDVTVEVEDISFHLHKFPLLSKSTTLGRLIEEASSSSATGQSEGSRIKVEGLPGGAKSFEMVAKFCYDVKMELTAGNVAALLCSAEHLGMTEDCSENNLLLQAETFLTQVVLHSWKDSLRTLQSCEALLPQAEELHIVERCVESLASKASVDPQLFGWPIMARGPMQSPGGSILWNGISTGSRPISSQPDWWYEDAARLNLSFYKRLISTMEAHGVAREVISGSLALYAKNHIPGLCRRGGELGLGHHHRLVSGPVEDQKMLLEEIDRLLPLEKNAVAMKFLFNLLRSAIILDADSLCVFNLEKRIGIRLDEASLEDLLMPSFSQSADEVLYNVDCVQRLLDHFLEAGNASPGSPANEECSHGSPSLARSTAVARLIDSYLAEIAPDVNLKLDKFQALAEVVPDYARPLDDGIYRAIDIFLKFHPWVTEGEKEKLCKAIDCQKLSLEACTHAAQNSRLPLRVIVQVLFFEQLQLRSSIAGCLMVSENSEQLRGTSEDGGGWAAAVRENQVLKVGMDSMRMRVAELEKECLGMRQEILKLGQDRGRGWVGVVPKKLVGFRIKSQMCSAHEDSVSEQKSTGGKTDKSPVKVNGRGSKYYIEG
ncbi:phototropic-responsive NPH3 family protein [Wolffia australiana]